MEYGKYPAGKTNYQIIDEFGDKTTITLDKWVADILQVEVLDVHAAIQRTYNKTVEKRPELSRREKGNLIREAAKRKANEYQETKLKILGWKDLDANDF